MNWLVSPSAVIVFLALLQMPTARSPVSHPERLVEMQHHFSQVFVIHEALIRGDLAAVRAPAAELARLPMPAGMAEAGAPYVAAIRYAGARATEATTLSGAAAAMTPMLTACGDCHRSLGVPVAAATPIGHDVGGVVGHMLDHQRAVDDLLRGLFVPSASQWRQGAERLRDAAVLSPDRLPADPKWTVELRNAETRLHKMARQAESDADPAARASRYADVITTCAQCHSLHARIWGPARGGDRH